MAWQLRRSDGRAHGQTRGQGHAFMSDGVTPGDTDHKLSTSALAKALQLPLQQLFATLRDYGWIRKVDEGWALTAKGEFEGGEYVHSRRYGRYIVWPGGVADHPLLRGLEDNRLLGAVQIGRKYGLGGREVMRLLGDLGLLRRRFSGWRLTERGEALGGVQVDHEGVRDIVWPPAVLEVAAVQQQLAYGRDLYAGASEPQTSLLDASASWQGLDGHCLDSRAGWMVCNWLYLAGVPHACQRALPIPGLGQADFWLPGQHIWIELSGRERDGSALAETLRRLAFYREQQWHLVEVRREELAHLDEYLTRELSALDVPVW